MKKKLTTGNWRTMTVSRAVRIRTERLLKRLEWPLAVLALLLVPVLILEDRTTDPTIRWLCSGVNWFVWLAFVGEFATGLAVATSRLKFAAASWFDLAIILLSPPFLVPDALQNMRSLRALRIFAYCASCAAWPSPRSACARRGSCYATKDSITSSLSPATVNLGAAGDLKAQSIRVDLEQFKSIKQTAFVSAVPEGIQLLDGTWAGELRADGQIIRRHRGPPRWCSNRPSGKRGLRKRTEASQREKTRSSSRSGLSSKSPSECQ